MAGSRTLKLSILAETKDLVAGLNQATNTTQTFGDKVSDFGKKAAIAFAAAGAAALAFAADAVKSAALDQAAQEKLAETIRATTNATAAQVAGVEDYITKTSIAIGVTDDELRPAYGRLVRSTKDVDEAQRLLNLALDLSVATGKPVEAISNALGRAYDGNTLALARLGLGLDANLLKSKDNEAIITSLEGTYGKFAEGAAETTAKKFERIRIATDEAKESIGAALLPIVEKLSVYVLETVVPNLESFINALTGKGSLAEATENGSGKAYEFGEQVKKVIKTVISLKDELKAVAIVIGTVFVVSKISAAITATIAAIKGLIAVYALLKKSAIIAGIAQAFALNPLLGLAAVALGAAILAGANRLFGDTDSSSASGGSSAPSGFKIPTLPQAPQSGVSGFGLQNSSPSNANATTINLTVNGALDKEGTARSIIDALNNSFYRGTGGASNLQFSS